MSFVTRLVLFAAAAQAAGFRNSSASSVAASSPAQVSASAAATESGDNEGIMRLMGPTPWYPYDPNTSSGCSWWYDNDGGVTCEEMPDWAFISREEWLHWNPVLGTSCSNFVVGRSYCIASFDDLPGSPPGGTPTTMTTTTSPPATTTTPPGNGISTPQPIQPGMVNNCDAFHVVTSGQTCQAIAQQYGITVAQFTTWNTGVGGAACTSLWLGVNVCVSIIGHSPPPPSTTQPGNGIQTPQPIREGMIGDCNRFHLVRTGETCAVIATQFQITVQQIANWNPSVGGTACTGLWAQYYVCVGRIGVTPQPPTPTTTTRPGNGIQTPQPTQPGMVANCDRFRMVQPGQTCAVIGALAGVTAARIAAWNGLGAGCAGLWANANACTRTIGYASSPATTCRADGNQWNNNLQAARDSVTFWCNGDSPLDGVGSYAIGQTKPGCYNAPNGNQRIEFTARNEFGAPATMSEALCNSMMRAAINSCPRGGAGTQEGWWFRSIIVNGRCP